MTVSPFMGYNISGGYVSLSLMCSQPELALLLPRPLYSKSARLVNLTLGRAGFFYAPQAPTRRATSGTDWTLYRKSVPRYPVIKGRGSICSRKSPPLKPLTTGFFGLSRLRRRNKNLQFSPRPLRQYNPKIAPRRLFLFIAPNPLTSVSASLGSAAASLSAYAA